MNTPVKERLEAARQEQALAEQAATNLQVSLTAAQQAATAARARVNALMSQVAALDVQINSFTQQIASRSAAIRTAQANIQRLMRQARQMESRGLPADDIYALIADAEAEIAGMQAEIESLSQDLQPLTEQRSTLNAELATATTAAAAADAQVASLTTQLTQTLARIETLKTSIGAMLIEQQRFDEFQALLSTQRATDVPVALLPVRLETRFIPVGSEFDFCIRVYPDDLHVETHEPALLDAEVAMGRHFWEQLWRAATDQNRRKAAWAQLAQRFGAPRAAWITRALKPTNWANRPGTPVDDGATLTVAPQFPNASRKSDAWTKAPAVRTLPDRWAVFGYREGQRVLFTWGAAIPAELAAGPSPSATRTNVRDDQLPMDAPMKWLVDFDEAVRVGMAVRVRLSAVDAVRGYDELVAVGLRVSLDGAAAAAQLASTLDAQHYTDGLSFVSQGTPTNNTPAVVSGFRSSDPGAEESYAAELAQEAVASSTLDNASVTAKAFGIAPSTFASVPGARNGEQADARAMNTALWPATWGYFVDQMMGNTVTPQQADTARRIFIDHVRGRGPVPALRVGRQPYGILPATSLDRWITETGDPVRATLVRLMRALRTRWREASLRVPRIGRRSDATGSELDLLDMMAVEPVSSGFQARPVIDSILFGTAAVPQLPNGLPSDIADRRQKVTAALAALGFNWQPRVLENAFLRDSLNLSGALVQKGDADPATRLNPDFLQWIRDTNFAALQNETLTAKPDSLLYLILRHAALLTYADTAHRILRSDNVVNTPKRPEPTLIGVLNTDSVTGLHEMQMTAPSLGNAVIADRIHEVTAAMHPAGAQLDEFRSSLSQLSQKSIGELSLLLPEALDCCAHRLDAWVTAVAADRMAKMRQTKATGVLLGGYGWVQNVKPDESRNPFPAPPGEEGRLMVDADSGGFVHAPSLNQAATAAVLRSGYRSNRNAESQPFAIDLSSERIRRAQWLLDGVREGQSLSALLGYRFERGLHENHPGVELDQYIETFRKLAPMGEIYQARAEKEAARAKADVATASAAAKRTEAIQITTQTTAALQQLTQAKAAALGETAYLQEQATQLRDEIRRVSGNPNPTEDTLERLAELNAALNEVQARLAFLADQLVNLEPQIYAATVAQAQAVARAQQLNSDAAALEVQAQQERQREQAAAARELQLLAEKRAALLLPPSAGAAAVEAIVAQDVVDGMALHKRYREAIAVAPIKWDETTIPFGKLGLPAVNTQEFQAIVTELRALDDSVDAVGDAVTAESVHQAVLGNLTKVGATLEAVAGGEPAPPELDVVKTPRTGSAITHRLMALLPEPAASGWPTNAPEVRAVAEPRIEVWAAGLLGDPRRIRCRAEYLVGGNVVGSREMQLSDLAISALDFLAMSEAGGVEAEDELSRRLRFIALRLRPGAVPGTATVRLDYARLSNWGTDILSIGEAVHAARCLARVVSSARTIDARDLAPADATVAPRVDVTDLGGRVDRILQKFRAAHAKLEQLIDEPVPQAAEQWRSALLTMSYFAVDAVPVSSLGDLPADRQALRQQADAVARDTAKRLRQLDSVVAGVDLAKLDVNARIELERERVSIMLGKNFRLAPRFTPANATEVNAALADGNAMLGGDPLAPVTWMQRMARVRAGTARLNDAFTVAQCVVPNAPPAVRVAQLPHKPGARWVALPSPGGEAPQAALSVVLHVPQAFTGTLPANAAGLMLDEWVEVVPGRAEQTAIAFQYDAPASRPPQSILLAVPPGDRATWDIEALEAVVLETFELARLRMVEPASLDNEVSHFLPALFFGLNQAGDTVSTDYRRAVAAAQA